MTRKVSEQEARTAIYEELQTLKNEIGGRWPLVEAFTDLDDHPEEDEDAGFNYIVGHIVGLCEAFGWEVGDFIHKVEPNPPEDDDSADGKGGYFDDPGGAVCKHCGEHSDDPNHAANCSESPEEDDEP